MGFRTVDSRLATFWAAKRRPSRHLCSHALLSALLLSFNLVGILHARKKTLPDLLSNLYFLLPRPLLEPDFRCCLFSGLVLLQPFSLFPQAQALRAVDSLLNLTLNLDDQSLGCTDRLSRAILHILHPFSPSLGSVDVFTRIYTPPALHTSYLPHILFRLSLHRFATRQNDQLLLQMVICRYLVP